MLEHLFGSKTRLKLLYLFYSYPERAFFVREISRQSGVQLNAVRREIANLAKIGIVKQVSADQAKTEEIGTERSKYFQLESNFVLWSELKSLLFRAHLLEEQDLIARIKKRAGEVKFLLLTGIFTGEKDIGTDLLLVGKIKPVSIMRLIKEFEKTLGRSIRYTVMDGKEFSERREIGDKFLYSLLEAKHLIAIDEYGLTKTY